MAAGSGVLTGGIEPVIGGCRWPCRGRSHGRRLIGHGCPLVPSPPRWIVAFFVRAQTRHFYYPAVVAKQGHHHQPQGLAGPTVPILLLYCFWVLCFGYMRYLVPRMGYATPLMMRYSPVQHIYNLFTKNYCINTFDARGVSSTIVTVDCWLKDEVLGRYSCRPKDESEDVCANRRRIGLATFSVISNTPTTYLSRCPEYYYRSSI